jgi:hypothetical protein
MKTVESQILLGLVAAISLGCVSKPPESFLPDHPGWRSKILRETKLSVSYTDETVEGILHGIGRIEGRAGLLDGIWSGPGLERRIDFRAANKTIREILWALSVETGMDITLIMEGRGFWIRVPDANGNFEIAQ